MSKDKIERLKELCTKYANEWNEEEALHDFEDLFLNNTNSIEQSILDAYIDCNMSRSEMRASGVKAYLNFMSEIVDMKSAIKYLKNALPDGYNDFDPEKLNILPKDWKVIVAREHSPCLYILGDKVSEIQQLKEILDCDEIDLYTQKDFKTALNFHNNRSRWSFNDPTFCRYPDSIKQIYEDLIEQDTVATRIWWD